MERILEALGDEKYDETILYEKFILNLIKE